jgi:hypothetical protein
VRRLNLLLPLAAFLGLAGFLGCGGSGGPQPGDIVTPQPVVGIGGEIELRAGPSASLGARLVAKGPNDTAPRNLNFQGIPSNVNPVASIRYYKDDTEVGTQEATLSHRC